MANGYIVDCIDINKQPAFDNPLLKNHKIQDPKTKNWWVILQNKTLGYYRGILFSKLAFANVGGWTGMTSTPRGIPSPPMGSGHFSSNNLKRACYFIQMRFQLDTRINVGPIKHQYALPSTDSSCYGVDYEGYNDEIQQYAMLFGDLVEAVVNNVVLL
ncbi:unnamed protein product [Lupinus luteus]|uniref:Neprosin PEP catalytic domain-containing protein n=1 Tax=Lupinus luteus TaxID=3873 RepID=A0AAV1W311_LUPLU